MHKNSYIIICLVVGSMFMLISCNKKKLDTYKAVGPSYYSYFNNQNREFTYDSIQIFPSRTVRFHHLIKEIINDSFKNQSGNKTLRLEQWRSLDTGKSYLFADIQTININEFDVQRVENNQRMVKMIFPIKDKRKWNGNAYNLFPRQDFYFENVEKPFVLNGKTFLKTVTVVQRREDLQIIEYDQYEVYAENIGLIYKYNKTYDRQTNEGYIVEWVLTKKY